MLNRIVYLNINILKETREIERLVFLVCRRSRWFPICRLVVSSRAHSPVAWHTWLTTDVLKGRRYTIAVLQVATRGYYINQDVAALRVWDALTPPLKMARFDEIDADCRAQSTSPLLWYNTHTHTQRSNVSLFSAGGRSTRLPCGKREKAGGQSLMWRQHVGLQSGFVIRHRPGSWNASIQIRLTLKSRLHFCLFLSLSLIDSNVLYNIFFDDDGRQETTLNGR